MALPRINFGAGNVQSLGRYDIGTMIGEGLARADVANKAVGVTGVLAKQYEDNKIEAETQEATIYALQERNGWIEREQQKVEYTADEVRPYMDTAKDSGFNVPLTEMQVDEDGVSREVNRVNIPAYELHPFMFKAHMDKVVEAAASKVTNERARNKLTAHLSAQVESEYGSMLEKSVATQKAYLRDRVGLNINNALDSGNYAIAEWIASQSTVLSSDERDKWASVIAERKETDTYETLEANEDIPGMKKALDFLRDGEAYEENGGSLEPRERRLYATQLRRAVDRFEAKGRAQANAELTVVKNRAAQIKRLNYEGRAVPASEVESTFKALLASGKPDAKRLAVELAHSQDFASVFDLMAGVSGSAGEKLIDETMRVVNDQYDPVDALDMETRLRKANMDKMRQVNDDAVTYAQDRLSLPVFDATDLPNSLAAAAKNGALLSTTFRVPPQFLSKAGWAEFKTVFDSAPETGKLEIANLVYKTFGGDTAAFYNDGMKKGAGILTQVGQLVSENQQLAARHVLRGAQLLKDKSVNLSTIQKDLTIQIANEISTAFPDSAVAAQKMDAVRNVYASLVWEAEGATAQESVNDNYLTTAIGSVTNGVIEYNGHTIEAPKRGVTSHSFEKLVESLSPRHFEQQGPLKDMSARAVTKGLKDGDFHFISVGNGMYGIVNDLNQPVIKEDNSPLIFDANEEPFTIAKDEALKKAKMLEEHPRAGQAILKIQKRREETRKLYGIELQF